jgi:hypothetical protein
MRLRSIFRAHPFFWDNLHNLKYAFRRKDETLSKADVTCVIATLDESLTIKYALESSKDFVSKYIIIDKNGSTAEALKEARDAFNLDLDLYVKPDMNLKQSWDYGFKKAKDPWVLLQDGDEVFYTEGERSIHRLRDYMNRPDIVLCAPKLLLYGSLRVAMRDHVVMPPHTLLYHNNGTIRQSTDPMRDHPVMDGWRIGLPHPFLFNCRKKRIQDDETRYMPYDPEKYYPYPRIVLKMLEDKNIP